MRTPGTKRYAPGSCQKKPSLGIGGDILDWLIGKETTRFKAFLKAHGTEVIKSIEVSRAPISKALDLGMDLISAGQFSKAKSKLGIDNFFHLGMIINNKYFLEKNETVNQRSPSNPAGEERKSVPLNGEITIDQLIENGSNKGKSKFWGDYDALRNNCQDFIEMTLKANGLYSAEIGSFVSQNVERLIEELPESTSHVANAITDTASIINRIIQFTTGGRLGFETGTEGLSEVKNLGRRNRGKNKLGPKFTR
jgi:hypothetical protein